MTEDDSKLSVLMMILCYALLFVAVVHAYDVSLRASKKREHELKEELTAAQRDSQEKDKQCSKLENDYYDMYKKMVAAKYDYEQAQEQLEKVQQKGN